MGLDFFGIAVLVVSLFVVVWLLSKLIMKVMEE